MATSGHISAHRAQPVHFSGPENTATVNPRLLGVSRKPTSFFGQAMVQSPHPLQRSSSMVIDGMVASFSSVRDCYIAEKTLGRQAELNPGKQQDRHQPAGCGRQALFSTYLGRL